MINKTIIAACPQVEATGCLAAAELLQAVSGFYEIVILVLVFLLGAVISLVYLSIRAASRRQIEEQFEKDLQSDWLQERIGREFDKRSQQSLSEIARRIELVEAQVAAAPKPDSDEDRVSETTIVPPGGQ